MRTSFFLLFFLLVINGITSFVYAQQSAVKTKVDQQQFNKAGYSLLNLSTTDALGRSFGAASANQQNGYVGLFYSLWLGQHKSGQRGVYDIQKLLNTNPAALNNPKGTPESPLNEFHFWGEPLYGYYSMSDPWVVTRHIE